MAEPSAFSEAVLGAAAERLTARMSAAFDLRFLGMFAAAGCTAVVPAPDSVLTIDKLRAMQRRLREAVPQPPADMLHRIIVTVAATKNGERLFPASRHRSRRVRKKLVRRFGGEFRQIPTTYKVGDTLLVHPVLAREVEHLARPHDPARGDLFNGIPMIWPDERPRGGAHV